MLAGLRFVNKRRGILPGLACQRWGRHHRRADTC